MNVVVICADTFRLDHLGFLKRQQVHTPNLDRLAAESAVFADFWLCSFPTVVNRIEVFSGTYAFPVCDWGPMPMRWPSLAELLSERQVATALISDNFHVVRQGFGLDRGFSHVGAFPSQGNDQFRPWWARKAPLTCPREKIGVTNRNLARYQRNLHWYNKRDTNSTACVFRAAIDWLAATDKQFFLWIDCFDPHEPWDAPANFLEPYPWDKEAAGVLWPHQGFATTYSPGEIANMRSLYKAEVSEVDWWVGELLAALTAGNRLADTAVLFCSDHGFYLGEHNLIGKLCRARTRRPDVIYEELGHIPLLFRHPAGLGAGTTITGLTQPPDLSASILDLAGVPPAAWAQGHSLVPRLRGEPGRRNFAICGAPPHRKGGAKCLTVHANDWCLIYSPVGGLAQSELYHQPSDPTHTRNVIADHRDLAAELHQMLTRWLDELQVPTQRREQLLHNAPLPPPHGFRLPFRSSWDQPANAS